MELSVSYCFCDSVKFRISKIKEGPFVCILVPTSLLFFRIYNQNYSRANSSGIAEIEPNNVPLEIVFSLKK